MTDVYQNARIALETRLSTYQSDNVAWENVDFVPETGTPFLRSSFLSAAPARASLGPSGVDRHRGVYQIEVAQPRDSGTGAAMAKVDAIIAHFPRGLNLQSGGVDLQVERTYPGPAFERDGFYVTPVSVIWYCYG